MPLCDNHGYFGPLAAMREIEGRMALRVPPHRDEPMAAYLARMAARVGYGSLLPCLGQSAPSRIDEPDVYQGSAKSAVARLFDLPADVFDAATPIRNCDNTWRLGKETSLPSSFFSFAGPRFCPDCFVADVAFGGQGPGRRVEAHLRTFWLSPCVRACPIHGVALETAHGGLAEIARWAVAGSRAPLPKAASAPAPQKDILLAAYVAGRLGFLPPRQEPAEMATLPLQGALALAKLVGERLLADPTLAPAPDIDPLEACAHGLWRLVQQAEPLASLLVEIGARWAKAGSQAPEPGLADLMAMPAYAPSHAWGAPLTATIQAVSLQLTCLDLRSALLKLAQTDPSAIFDRFGLPGPLAEGGATIEAETATAGSTRVGTLDAGNAAADAACDQLLLRRRAIAQERLGVSAKALDRLIEFGVVPPPEGMREPVLERDLQKLSDEYCAGLPVVKAAGRGEILLIKLIEAPIGKAMRARVAAFLTKRADAVGCLLRAGSAQNLCRPRLGDLILRRSRLYGQPRVVTLNLGDGRQKLIGFSALGAYLGYDETVARRVWPLLRADYATQFSAPRRRKPIVSVETVERFVEEFVHLVELDERLPEPRAEILASLAAKRVEPAMSCPSLGAFDAFYRREEAEAALGLR